MSQLGEEGSHLSVGKVVLNAAWRAGQIPSRKGRWQVLTGSMQPTCDRSDVQYLTVSPETANTLDAGLTSVRQLRALTDHSPSVS